MARKLEAVQDVAPADEWIRIPYGSSRGRRSETQVSTVGGGRHVNFYLSDELTEVARTWPHGAAIKFKWSNNKPDVICFMQATRKGYSLRSRTPAFARS